MEDKAEAQVQVRFVTKQEKYAVPDSPYAIKSNISTTELSTLVNALIKETDSSFVKSVDFDFLICGELLRSSVEEHLQEKGVSTEDTIELEYFERLPAPTPQDCLMHDDWVSAVHGNSNGILSGSYDNSIHIWTTKGQHKLAIPGHTSPVKAVSWVTFQEDRAVFVSGSHDQTAMLWVWNVSKNSVECVITCRGHDKGVECIAVSADAKRFVTGGWDTNICLWSASLDDVDHVPDKKKNKSEHGNSKVQKPQSTLQGHKECVSGVQWMDYNTVLSSGWDHLLKIWDCELGGIKQEIAVAWRPLATRQKMALIVFLNHAIKVSSIFSIYTSTEQRPTEHDCTPDMITEPSGRCTTAKVLYGDNKKHNGNKAFFDVDWSPLNNSMITASADRHIRLYDPRSTESIVKATYTSHTNWVQSVRWSKTRDTLFLSAGYDSKVKLWDTRSPVTPLYDLSGHEDKVMCCDWSNPSLLISGACDNTLRIFKSKYATGGAQ